MHGHKDERTRDELASLGYERGDIGLRTIAVWVFWFFAFAVAAGIATAGIYQILVPGGLGPQQAEKRTRFPAEPRLQDDVSVKTDIYDLRLDEQKALRAAGPSEYNKGAYSIPIDVAIKKWSQENAVGNKEATIVEGEPDVIVTPEPSGTQSAPGAGGTDH